MALAAAGAAARGATAYVTLEPCWHHGRTPPCADALIAAGVARVVVAAGDPTAQVDGRGVRAPCASRASTVEVLDGAHPLAIARAPAEGGLRTVVVDGPPARAYKAAATLDGRTATARRATRRWISLAGQPRASCTSGAHEAAQCSSGAAPRSPTTPRSPRATPAPVPERQPLRVVADRAARLPVDGTLAAHGRGRCPSSSLVAPDAPADRRAALEARRRRDARRSAGLRDGPRGARRARRHGGALRGRRHARRRAARRGGLSTACALFVAPLLLGDAEPAASSLGRRDPARPDGLGAPGRPAGRPRVGPDVLLDAWLHEPR